MDNEDKNHEWCADKCPIMNQPQFCRRTDKESSHIFFKVIAFQSNIGLMFVAWASPPTIHLLHSEFPMQQSPNIPFSHCKCSFPFLISCFARLPTLSPNLFGMEMASCMIKARSVLAYYSLRHVPFGIHWSKNI